MPSSQVTKEATNTLTAARILQVTYFRVPIGDQAPLVLLPPPRPLAFPLRAWDATHRGVLVARLSLNRDTRKLAMTKAGTVTTLSRTAGLCHLYEYRGRSDWSPMDPGMKVRRDQYIPLL
ncbi:hypothetical protein CLCR_11025 [Cladophialophora carrionii]|uniref:Uncharacterized protein n=1 Tax=Cladophialophora carrionii TaxID=86049 RepID=A0A1C1CYE2_9EURO|nr:hypothetical protein CLCR_11025 [Cladophialophora carrionii]